MECFLCPRATRQSATKVAYLLTYTPSNEIVKQEVATNGVARQYSPSFTISIADFLQKINPSDESFYKYIPKKLLQTTKQDENVRYTLKEDSNANVEQNEEPPLPDNPPPEKIQKHKQNRI